MWARNEAPPFHWLKGYEGEAACGHLVSSFLTVKELQPHMKVCQECLIAYSTTPVDQNGRSAIS